MITQLAIFTICSLPNGRLLLAGKVTGPPPTVGQRGHGTTSSGEVQIEVISFGLRDPLVDKPDVQTLQVLILKGDPGSLKGATVIFDI